MKEHVLKLAVMCLAGLLVGPVFAQDEGARPRARRGDREAARRAGGDRGARADRGKERTAKMLEELKLKKEQEAPVQQILTTHQQQMAQWMQQNGPVMRELLGKLRGGRGRRGEDAPEQPKVSDDERKAATEKIRELQKQRLELTQNVLKQLKDVLTEEQMAVARRHLGQRSRGRASGPPLWALGQLGLSQEQQAKVGEMRTAAREAMKDKDRAGRAKAMQETWDAIVKDVLTDEQRKKLEELQKRGPSARGAMGGTYAGLDLTDKQNKKIQEIMAEARKKIQATEDRDAKRQAYMDARKKIADEVLTAEQREKLEKSRKQRMEGARRGRGAGGQGGRRRQRDNRAEPVIVD